MELDTEMTSRNAPLAPGALPETRSVRIDGAEHKQHDLQDPVLLIVSTVGTHPPPGARPSKAGQREME